MIKFELLDVLMLASEVEADSQSGALAQELLRQGQTLYGPASEGGGILEAYYPDGGHSVPDNKVTERIPRMLENVAKAVPLCDTVSFFDNTLSTHPFSRVAVLFTHRTLHRTQNLPEWAENCIGAHYINVQHFT